MDDFPTVTCIDTPVFKILVTLTILGTNIISSIRLVLVYIIDGFAAKICIDPLFFIIFVPILRVNYSYIFADEQDVIGGFIIETCILTLFILCS